MRFRCFLFGLGLAAAAPCIASCGSSDPSGGPAKTTCLDASGAPTSHCAVEPKGDICNEGDATKCVPVTTVEVDADDGKTGVCLHLVLENDCDGEIFADTCIEIDEGPGKSWQCWTSSTLEGATIDVGTCHATGKYFEVATTSAGTLGMDEQKCDAPL